MDPRISDAIVIIEPNQPGDRPASTKEQGDTPILVLLLRQLMALGIDRVMVSASRAHERSIRPLLAGHRGLPVCEMVAGPLDGPDSSAAAFYRSRRQLDSSPLLMTRGSLLPEPGTWLDRMLDRSASNAAVFSGETPHTPRWAQPVIVSNDRIVGRSPEEIDPAGTTCFLSGTYALDVEWAEALFRSLSTKKDKVLQEVPLEDVILDLVEEGHSLDATKSAKTAWLCAETAFST